MDEEVNRDENGEADGMNLELDSKQWPSERSAVRTRRHLPGAANGRKIVKK